MNSRVRSVLTGIAFGGIFALLIVVSSGPGWAPPLIKMGVVNWEQVVMKYKGFQSEMKELQRRRVQILEYIQKETGNRPDTSGSVSSGKRGDPEMQGIYQDTLKQIEKRRRSLRQEYHQNIYQAIRGEAIERGFSLVLSENEVLYASEEYTDLTNGVIERLNQQD